MYLKEPAAFPEVSPEKAIRYLETALFLYPDSNQSLSLVAQVRALYPDVQVCNGQCALQLAQDLCQRTRNSNPHSLSVLAAAYTENGQFDKAIVTIQRAIALAQEQNEGQHLDQLRECLQLYGENIPYRLLPEQLRLELP